MLGRHRVSKLCFIISACGWLLANRAIGEELARRGLVGVQLAPVSHESVTQLKLPAQKGVLITVVMPDTPAQRADLKSNDVVVKIGDRPTDDMPALFTSLRGFRAGDKVPITVLREGAELKVEVTLAPRPKESSTDYEVIYDAAGAEGERVRTIITKPTGDGKHPAILFIQGLGPMSVEFAGPNARHPFKRFFDEFTKAGYVVMRAERVGIGDSDGIDPTQTMTAADVKSFGAALKKLKTYDYVDANSVFVLTHASGGSIVPRVVEAAPVKGVITYAVNTRPWNECALEAAKRRWELELLDKPEIESKSEKMTRFMKLCYLEKKSPADVVAQNPDLKEFVAEFVQNDAMIDGIHYRFYQDLVSFNAVEAWKKVDTNVLALWGEADFIAARKDSEMVVEIVNAAHPGKATFTAIKGIDHVYSKAEDAEEAFLAGFGGDFNKIIVETADAWMKKLIGPTKSP